MRINRIYIAALANVSPELHGAAIIDGATIVRRIWHIDLPSIIPTAKRGARGQSAPLARP